MQHTHLNRNPQDRDGNGAYVALLTSSVSRRAAGVFDAVRNLAKSLQDKVDYPVQVLGFVLGCDGVPWSRGTICEKF
jgi:hypothetical protein